MRFEKGIPASIAARFDRMITKRNMETPMKRHGEGGTTIVLHPRTDKDGKQALIRFPVRPVFFSEQEIALIDNKTIVHTYDRDGKLIYRKRINENPEGIEVDAGLDIPHNGVETHYFLEKRMKELGWVE